MSPGRTEVTPGPTDSTRPAPSWPRIQGNFPTKAKEEELSSGLVARNTFITVKHQRVDAASSMAFDSSDQTL